VSKRLALIGPKVTADKAHDILEEAVEPDQVYPFHLAFITHGRQVCKAQRPLCDECVVAEDCPSREEFTAPAETIKKSAKKTPGTTAKGRTKKAARLPHSVAITE
jgi:endonuclease-3